MIVRPLISVSGCSAVNGLVCSLDGKQTFEEVKIHETLFPMDRGYNSKSIYEMCVKADARLMRTRKREYNFPLTFDVKKKAKHQRIVPEKGTFGAYFVSENCFN